MASRFYKTILSSALSVGFVFFLTGAGEFISAVSVSGRPNYEFLPHLRLNVALLKIIDDATPLPENEAREMAYTPNMLLKDFARQRFICEGKTGEAVLNIRQASLTRHPDNYSGKIFLSLTMENPAFPKTGNLSAEVSRTVKPFHGEKDSDVLLRLTNLLLDDMNVEIEYQLRNKFPNWLIQPGTDNSQKPSLSLPPAPQVEKRPPPVKVKHIAAHPVKNAAPPAASHPKGLQPLPPPPPPRTYN